MIVNPQLFNYRLITGSLIVTVAVLSVFSFSSYQSNQADQKYIEQEKKLVEIELSHMIKRYDEVSLKNDLFASQLENANNKAEIAWDSLQFLRLELSSMAKIKDQIVALESRNNLLSKDIKSANQHNAELQAEKLTVSKELQNLQEINSSLSAQNKILKEVLEKASVLSANSFSAKALNKVLGKSFVTDKASKAESIEVSFTLAENVFVEKGEKDIYIQILTPENNVFADKGAVTFGESSLIYSIKKIVAYNNGAMDVSIAINAEEDDRPLVEGNYYISVFNNYRKLGGTQLQLD